MTFQVCFYVFEFSYTHRKNTSFKIVVHQEGLIIYTQSLHYRPGLDNRLLENVSKNVKGLFHLREKLSTSVFCSFILNIIDFQLLDMFIFKYATLITKMGDWTLLHYINILLEKLF